MYPGAVAKENPDRPALIMGGTGETVTYAELDERINRLSHLFRERGLHHGDHIAILMENQVRFLEVAWAAQLSGLYYTALNTHLTPEEAAYIVTDSESRLLVSSAKLAEVAGELTADLVPKLETRLMVDGTIDGWESYEDEVAAQPATPIDDQAEGDFLLYSSGTTGRPKGIRRPLTLSAPGEKPDFLAPVIQMIGFVPGDVYLAPAPLYHSAPLGWSMSVQRQGGTVVLMGKFDAELALSLIDEHKVNIGNFVPTMFVRMLKLPDEVRNRYDVSSLKGAVHGAAPCPVEVKQAMIDWWGKIIVEFYGSTEGIGFAMITSEEWLSRPGTVGRSAFGTPHILDDEGNELAPGEVGTIWFADLPRFDYHNDAAKTSDAYNDKGWATVGDMGYLDEDGYLFLTDRKSFMIISGGVNIYPQEAENVLVNHPKVMDVAVIGVPNQEMGEEVKAVVQPMDWAEAGSDLEAELLEYCRANLAHYKCPRSVDFEPELPRLDNGKLYKRLLRDRYWAAAGK